MSDAQSKFQCPTCKWVLDAVIGVCIGCGKRYVTEDGILDFVGGRFDTTLDAETYEAGHAIDDSAAEIEYGRIKRAAADRWPASLGSVVEIGCGTGYLSRAFLGHRDASDAVLTDVSTDMLRVCRNHLTRLGLVPALPIRFATFSAHEQCFRDEAFDTCIGGSVLHHITDVRAFLNDLWRILKPGGRAFFTEPGFRYTRVMAMTFADIIAFMLARDPAFSQDRQTLHNWVAEARRGTMLQGDLETLEDFEDKHMFIGEDFEAMALDIGFATAEALPASPDPDGLGNVGGLLDRIQVGEPVASDVMRLWPVYVRKYMALLNAKDRSAGYVFWLTKASAAARSPTSQSLVLAEPELSSAAEVTGGGMPLLWELLLTATPVAEGLRLKATGWCLANPDVRWVRIRIGEQSRNTPVWFPRADVHVALNREGRYAAWNSLCCGIEDELLFGVSHVADQTLHLDVDLVFADNRFVPIVTDGALQVGETFVTRH